MKTIFFISVFSLFSISLFAQWQDGGTIHSIVTDQHHFWPKNKVAEDGTVYIAFSSRDTLNGLLKIHFTAVDAKGNEKPGWPAILIDNFYMSGLQIEFDIAISPEGHPILVWEGIAEGESFTGLYAQKFSKEGFPMWNAVQPTTIRLEDNYSQRFPAVAATNDGGLFVAWMRYDTTGTLLAPDVICHKLNSSGQLDTNWNATPHVVEGELGNRESYPAVAYDPNTNHAYVSWFHGPIGNSRLTLQRFDMSDGSIAENWPSPGIILSYGPYLYPLPLRDYFLECNSSGEAIMTFVETKVSFNGEAFFHRIQPDGTSIFGFHPKTIDIGESESGLGFLHSTVTENDELIVCWNDFANGYDVFVTRLNMMGEPIWPQGKVKIAPLTENYYPRVADDGAGGAYVLFRRNGELLNIRIEAQGAVAEGWTEQGNQLGLVTSHDSWFPEHDYMISATRHQGAVATWNQRPAPHIELVKSCNIERDGSACSVPLGPISTSKESLFSKETFLVTPNPSSKKIQLQTLENQKGTINIFSFTGQLIYTKKAFSGTETIAIENFPEGIYSVQFFSENGKRIHSNFVKMN